MHFQWASDDRWNDVTLTNRIVSSITIGGGGGGGLPVITPLDETMLNEQTLIIPSTTENDWFWEVL